MTKPDASRAGWFVDGSRPDRPATIYEERRQEDDSESGLWTDLESRATECASRASTTAPSRTSAARAPSSFRFKAGFKAAPATTNNLPGGILKKWLRSGDSSSQSSSFSETSYYYNKVNKIEDSTVASNSSSVGYDIMDPDHQLLVVVNSHGDIERLEVQELAYIPKPNRPDQIVIMVHCSTITLQDCMIRRGKWYEMQELPFVPGSDVVGTIFSMGHEASECSTFRVGDKISAVVPSGGNAKYITLPYQSLIRVPNEIDSVMALCLISTYVPAREALSLARKSNTPFTGANVLVIRGNDPSSLAAIELALMEGANVFTTADERHHGYLSSLGAKCFPIDPDKWLWALREKMDLVLDSVCLDGYESSSEALSPDGTLVCMGMSALYTRGKIHAFGMRDVRDYKAMYYKMKAKYMMGKTIYYDRLERYDQVPEEYAQHFLYLCHLVSKNSFKPRVACRSRLDSVASTQRAIEHGVAPYGVCVCTPWTTKPRKST